jgi:hypothetical protein
MEEINKENKENSAPPRSPEGFSEIGERKNSRLMSRFCSSAFKIHGISPPDVPARNVTWKAARLLLNETKSRYYTRARPLPFFEGGFM